MIRRSTMDNFEESVRGRCLINRGTTIKSIELVRILLAYSFVINTFVDHRPMIIIQRALARGCSSRVSPATASSTEMMQEEQEIITVKVQFVQKEFVLVKLIYASSPQFFSAFSYFLIKTPPKFSLSFRAPGSWSQVLTRMIFAERASTLRVETLALEVLLAHLKRIRIFTHTEELPIDLIEDFSDI